MSAGVGDAEDTLDIGADIHGLFLINLNHNIDIIQILKHDIGHNVAPEELLIFLGNGLLIGHKHENDSQRQNHDAGEAHHQSGGFLDDQHITVDDIRRNHGDKEPV